MRKTLKRRRSEGKTDYKHRKRILKGDAPRIIFRKTNRYIIGQCTISEESKDKVLSGVTSKELINYGWPKEWSGSLKSMPASYLTGFLLGKKTSKLNVEKCILDLGLIRNVAKSRIYSFAKGFKDSGVEIKFNEKALPKQERIEGMHMKKDIKKYMGIIIDKISKEGKKKNE